MISIHNKNQREGEKEKEGATTEEVIEISLASKRHWELQNKNSSRSSKRPRQVKRDFEVKARRVW